MNALRRMVGRHHRVFAMLVLLVLATRLLVPAGYMPVAGGGALTICSGTMPVAAATHPHRDQHPAPPREQPCAFGVAAMPSLAAIESAMPVPPAMIALRIAAPLRTIPAPRPRTHLPPSRGPPIAA